MNFKYNLHYLPSFIKGIAQVYCIGRTDRLANRSVALG